MLLSWRLLLLAALTRNSLAEEKTCSAGDETCSADTQVDGSVTEEEELQWSAIKVDLDRSGGLPLGVKLWPTGETMRIDSISEGAVQLWNAKNPDKEVRVGDHIVEVNGVNGTSSSIVEELQKLKIHEVWIMFPAEESTASEVGSPAPPTSNNIGSNARKDDLSQGLSEWIVILDRTNGEKLGLGMQKSPETQTLVMDAVSDTECVAKSWNRRNPDKALKIGDQIVEVNGVRGDINGLVEELKQSKRHMVIVLGVKPKGKEKKRSEKKSHKSEKAKDKSKGSSDAKVSPNDDKVADGEAGFFETAILPYWLAGIEQVKEWIQPYTVPAAEAFKVWWSSILQSGQAQFKRLWKFLSKYAGQSFEGCWVFLSILSCIVVFLVRIVIELVTLSINWKVRGSFREAWSMLIANVWSEDEDEYIYELVELPTEEENGTSEIEPEDDKGETNKQDAD